MPLPRTLRTATFKLTALYVAIFVVSVAALGTVVFWTVRSALTGQLADHIEAETRFLEKEFLTGGRDRLLTAIKIRSRATIALDYLLLDPSGAPLAGELPPSRRPVGWSEAVVSESDEPPDTRETERILVTDLKGGLQLWVGDDTGRITAALHALYQAFGWAIAILLLVGVAGGLMLSRAYLTLVDDVTRTAEAIIAGHLGRRVAIRGTGDDFDQLAQTLNRMLDRIEGLMQSLRQVGSDVAHDLRTPLTQLRLLLEGTQAHARTVFDYETAIQGAVDKTVELEAIFSALLRIAQIESTTPAALFKPVRLQAVVERVADAFTPDAEEGGRTLLIAGQDDVTVQGDQELLTQMLVNLVENALRHTPRGARVSMSLTAMSEGACLTVEDDGPGIPEREVGLVCQRFYRGERSRTRPGSGTRTKSRGSGGRLAPCNFATTGCHARAACHHCVCRQSDGLRLPDLALLIAIFRG